MTNIINRNKNANSGETARTVMPYSGLIDGVLHNTLKNFFDDNFWGFNGLQNSTNVPVNIRETDRSYEMEVVAPGLKKENFQVNISDNMLTVSFEKTHEEKKENKQEGYMRHEYRMNSFNRSFTLDENTIDSENISAEYRDGVLYLSIPKKEGVQKLAKTIEVK